MLFDKQELQWFIWYSEPTTIIYGVPQGSILGTLLINIYIIATNQIMEQYNITNKIYIKYFCATT